MGILFCIFRKLDSEYFLIRLKEKLWVEKIYIKLLAP